MKDPRDQDQELVYCKCDQCEGQIGYEPEHILNPDGYCYSRWCATLKDLEYFENEGSPISRTNAEFELRTIGAKEFFKKYYNAPLEPFIKPDQVNELFDEIAEMQIKENNKLETS